MPTLISNSAEYVVSYGPMGSHYLFKAQDFYDLAGEFVEVEKQFAYTYVNAIPQNSVSLFYDKMRAYKKDWIDRSAS